VIFTSRRLSLEFICAVQLREIDRSARLGSGMLPPWCKIADVDAAALTDQERSRGNVAAMLLREAHPWVSSTSSAPASVTNVGPEGGSRRKIGQ
jgi:hypothetical protein